MVVYQAVIAVAAVATGVILVASATRLGNGWAVLALAVSAVLAERGRVTLGPDAEVSISLLPTVFAAAVFGPLAAMIVAAVSYVGDFPPLLRGGQRAYVFRRGAPYLKWGIYTAVRAIYGAAAGLAALYARKMFGSTVGQVVAATAAATVVAEPLDLLFAALTYHLRGGRGRDIVKKSGPMVIAAMPFYAPVVALLAVAYDQVSPWTLPLFLAPALAAQRLFALYQEQRRLAHDLTTANERLQAANLSFATALVATLDARDRYTAGHSAAVAIYARDISVRMGLTTEEQQLAHLCGLVHDIGKIGLPAGLLEKPGALTLDERREMQRHSEIGERILANVETYAEIASVVRHHHERVDGEGYPDGLVDNEIPLLARIIAVADAYNAMTSDRPYRDAMPSRVARLRLAQAVETQFDTSVVAAFEAILAGAHEDYRLARGTPFALTEQALTRSEQRSVALA
jgi:HD-GYP domain-containing protein (c-di-GMP phosphodiesterase class II)